MKTRRFWHPSGVQNPQCRPTGSLAPLRPPANFWQPFRLRIITPMRESTLIAFNIQTHLFLNRHNLQVPRGPCIKALRADEPIVGQLFQHMGRPAGEGACAMAKTGVNRSVGMPSE